MNHAYRFENHRGPLCFGADAHCGGALVPLLHSGGGVLAGVYGFRPAGGLRLFCRAAYRVYRGSGAGVPGFPLWAPGPGRLAGGAPVWCEVCGDGLYGELILTSGHFVQKFRAAAGTDRRLFFLLGKEVRLSLQPTSGPIR